MKVRNWLILAFLSFLLAGGSFLLTREQDRIRSLYGPQPQTISVEDLIEKGYGNNIWLDLKDVEIGPKFIIQTRGGEKNQVVWFPAFPLGKAREAKSIDVILRSTKCKSDADIRDKFVGRTSFRGAVINPILLKPYDPYRPLLRETYPNHALPETILEVDVEYLTPPSEQWAKGFYYAAGGFGLLGALCICIGLIRGMRGSDVYS